MRALLDKRQSAAAIALWATGEFDTCDIAQMVSAGGGQSVSEAEIHRFLQAARHIAREVA